MKKHAIISFILIGIFIIVPIVVHAATFVRNTTSFGGRVIATMNPAVTCTGFGTGPLTIIGVYSPIPYYAVTNFTGAGFISNAPKVGSWILGRVNVIPEFSSCYIPYLDNAPFPVKDTSFYGTSR